FVYLLSFVILLLLPSIFFFFPYVVDHRDLHSFPTRRSSDLDPDVSVRRSSQYERITWLNAVVGRHSFVHAVFVVPNWKLPFEDADRKSTRLNSSHQIISYAVFCLKKKKITYQKQTHNSQRKC